MRVETATLLLATVMGVLFLSSCNGRGDKPNEIETVKVVYRDRLVPAPCPEKVTKPRDPLMTIITGGTVEDNIDALILSDSLFRQYVPDLERAAKACGVTIAN